MDPVTAIKNARLQYIYNLKLYDYLLKDKINRYKFDKEIELISFGGSLLLQKNLFSDEDIIDGAANNIMLSLGTLFIMIDTCLSDLGFHNDANNTTASGMYRTLIYMLKSAFAHNMLQPKWKIKGSYSKIKFNLRLKHGNIKCDLSKLNGKLFKEEDLGGYKNIKELVDFSTDIISKLLKKKNTEMTTG